MEAEDIVGVTVLGLRRIQAALAYLARAVLGWCMTELLRTLWFRMKVRSLIRTTRPIFVAPCGCVYKRDTSRRFTVTLTEHLEACAREDHL